MPETRLTEEQIEGLLRQIGPRSSVNLFADHFVQDVAQALRQVREDLRLSREHHDATLAVLRGLAAGADEAREDRDLYQAEVAALQAERENRERYWDGVRRLMIEAGAEPGDAEHLARSLIDQRDAARWQVRRLRESIEDLRFRGFTVDLLPGSMTTGDPPILEYRGKNAGYVPVTVQRLLLSWKADIAALAAGNG